jgi:hypothetical protein
MKTSPIASTLVVRMNEQRPNISSLSIPNCECHDLSIISLYNPTTSRDLNGFSNVFVTDGHTRMKPVFANGSPDLLDTGNVTGNSLPQHVEPHL